MDAVNAQTGGIEVRDTTPLNREGLDAAADMFWTLGVHHGWWKETVHQSWRFYDPIGREEFLDEVARIVRAYQSRLPGLAHLTREAKSE